MSLVEVEVIIHSIECRGCTASRSTSDKDLACAFSLEHRHHGLTFHGVIVAGPGVGNEISLEQEATN